jgi:hypothetical protein
MKTFLKKINLITNRCLVLSACCLITNSMMAQSGNLLSNPSFESPVQPNINGNNIIGVGVPFGGWNCSGNGFNIIHVNGAGYTLGPDNAADGVQYVDVASSNGYISTTFVLTAPAFVSFKGSFSTREQTNPNYANWTAVINIQNSSYAILASSNTMNFTNAINKNNWYTLSGSTSLLAPGTYIYGAYVGDWGHFDNASVTATLASPLPVKIESFTAEANGSIAALNWSVSQEINVNHYVVEKSFDGKNFSDAGIVFAYGNSTDKLNYSFSDNISNIQASIIYYRLRTVDIDGRIEYSETRLIRNGKQADNMVAILTYPNPVRSELRVTIPAKWQGKEATYQILGSNGQVAKKIESASSNQTQTVDISTLPPGFYFVIVKCNGETAQQKIVKQ